MTDLLGAWLCAFIFAKNVPIGTTIAFLNCFYQPSITVIVVIPLRSCGVKEEETLIVINELVKWVGNKWGNCWLQEEDRF